MASLGSIRFFSGDPEMHISATVEAFRDGGTVYFRLYTTVSEVIDPRYFGFNIMANPIINGAGQGESSIKGNAPSQWSSALTTYFPASGYYAVAVDPSVTSLPVAINVYSTNYAPANITLSGTATFSAGYTACTPPASLSLSAILAESNAVLSWSGASGGLNNGITGYLVQYQDSSDGVNWGSTWTTLGTVAGTSTPVSPPSTRGYYRRFQVRTQGTAGAVYYSAFQIAPKTLRRNSAPLPPATITLNRTDYTDGGPVTINWSGASDPDGNLDSYRIVRQFNLDILDGRKWEDDGAAVSIPITTGSGSYTDSNPLTTGNIPDTAYFRYAIQSVDTFGAASFLVYSPVLQRVDGAVVYIKADEKLIKGKPSIKVGNALVKGRKVYIKKGSVLVESKGG